MEHEHVLAIAVGNTRTRIGLFHGTDLESPMSLMNEPVASASGMPSAADAAGIDAIVAAVSKLLEGSHNTPIVIADVNKPFAKRLALALEALSEVWRVGEDVAVPMKHSLDDASTLGMDRQLCALAASRRAEQAVVVIDAGTAITVDFVDGEGVFQGGIIAPGVRMMLASLHGKTAALPKLEFAAPDPQRGPFGKDTAHAMILGVIAAARGAVRHAIDLYADAYEAYPQIVATGGDAAMLFENDGLVEHIVPDLQLVGILEAWRTEDDGTIRGSEKN
jgi:type III pantothenate kinase